MRYRPGARRCTSCTRNSRPNPPSPSVTGAARTFASWICGAVICVGNPVCGLTTIRGAYQPLLAAAAPDTRKTQKNAPQRTDFRTAVMPLPHAGGRILILQSPRGPGNHYPWYGAATDNIPLRQNAPLCNMGADHPDNFIRFPVYVNKKRSNGGRIRYGNRGTGLPDRIQAAPPWQGHRDATHCRSAILLSTRQAFRRGLCLTHCSLQNTFHIMVSNGAFPVRN